MKADLSTNATSEGTLKVTKITLVDDESFGQQTPATTTKKDSKSSSNLKVSRPRRVFLWKPLSFSYFHKILDSTNWCTKYVQKYHCLSAFCGDSVAQFVCGVHINCVVKKKKNLSEDKHVKLGWPDEQFCQPDVLIFAKLAANLGRYSSFNRW